MEEFSETVIHLSDIIGKIFETIGALFYATKHKRIRSRSARFSMASFDVNLMPAHIESIRIR